jgi:hypothetical protein
MWSLLFVGTAARFGSGVVPRQWTFLKQWTTPVAMKMKGRDLIAYFNVILLYIVVLVVPGVIF